MTMTRRRTRFATAVLAAMALSSLMFAGATAKSELSAVRQATTRFHSLTQAGRAGYGAFPAGVPLHECITNLNGPGAMGFHWVNGNLLDKVLDPTKPEVLVYAPDADGDLHLAALEYVIFQADWYADHPANSMPSLFGHDLMVGDHNRFQIPPFFALHVWLYQSNPTDMFASFNPNVSCGGTAAASTKLSATAPILSAAAKDARRFACGVPAATA
jgi:type II secretory pathway pseudopilin PulG